MTATKTFEMEAVLAALKSVLPRGSDSIALHEPYFRGNEWKYVKECLDTGWVSSVGKFVDLFENLLAEFTGTKRAVAAVNGTAALHICLKLLGVEAEDEVLSPTLTFIATVNAIAYCGAVPHFVDCDAETLGISPSKLSAYLREITEMKKDGCVNKSTGRRIKALVVMHVFGHPVDLDPIVALCDEYKIELIEDAAESLGSYYKGRHTGNWGKMSALSFNGNKTITTGGGGAILTNDIELGKLAKHITTTAKIPHKWAFVHDMVGFNYRLPNINAALGCAQLEQLPAFLSYKRTLAGKYKNAFESVPGVRFFEEPIFAKSNYWLNTLILDESFSDRRDAVLETTNSQGIMTRPAWALMHRLPIFAGSPRMDPMTAESLERRIINIPSSPVLGERFL